jgi:hypothetical protein
MAKKKTGYKGGAKRTRRSPEQMIADLQKKIEEVKQRAAAKELKQSPAMKRTVTILRSITKAMDEAAEEKNGGLRHSLADAHRLLAAHLETQGVKPPKPRMPRGRRPVGS